MLLWETSCYCLFLPSTNSLLIAICASYILLMMQVSVLSLMSCSCSSEANADCSMVQNDCYGYTGKWREMMKVSDGLSNSKVMKLKVM